MWWLSCFKSLARSLKQFPTLTFSNSLCAELKLREEPGVYAVRPSCPWLWLHGHAEWFCWRDLVLGRACQVGRASLADGKGNAFWVKDQPAAICWIFFLQLLQRIIVENSVFTVQFKGDILIFCQGENISFFHLCVRERQHYWPHLNFFFLFKFLATKDNLGRTAPVVLGGSFKQGKNCRQTPPLHQEVRFSPSLTSHCLIQCLLSSKCLCCGRPGQVRFEEIELVRCSGPCLKCLGTKVSQTASEGSIF